MPRVAHTAKLASAAMGLVVSTVIDATGADVLSATFVVLKDACACSCCSQCNGKERAHSRSFQFRKFDLLPSPIGRTNHVSDHVLERTDLPDHLITGAAGQVVFQDENYLVAPFGHFPEQDINLASQRLIPQHMQQWPLERILRQRHVVRSVPVSEADFSFKDKRGRFWVYGLDRQVWAPEYPHKCCCGCTVM
eukprot:m.306473 g.306473  ORF g.306473 m.306473 type:complete len:193 (-) comp55306_c1_seq6:13-591(-)